MPAPDAMTCEKLSKLIGTPRAPVVLDMRRDDLRRSDPRLIPTARPLPEDSLSPEALTLLAAGLRREAPGRPVLVACAEGHGRSQGAAAWLRHEGLAAEYLEGGHAAWVAANLPLFDPARLGRLDPQSRSLWVTRSRPKIDRIACPWLIRRFIDPRAVFWSHRGETCTFDTLIREFGLTIPALDRLAIIVRGADTARPDLAPECAGLLAASLGLSRMYSDDQEQLDAGMALYDAFYRWCRDATAEVHNWQSHGEGGT